MADEDVEAVVGLVIAAGLLAVAFYAAFFLIPIAILIFVGWLIHYALNKSPTALERKAREHTHALYREALERYGFRDSSEFAAEVIARLPELPPSVDVLLGHVAMDLYENEQYPSIPEPPLICNSIEGARYRDLLSKLTAHDTKHAADIVTESFRVFVSFLPAIRAGTLLATVPPNQEAILHTILPFLEDNTFADLGDVLERNIHDVSGVPYHVKNSSKFVLPTEYKGENVQYAYLKDTPLLSLFDLQLPFSVPEESKWEHTAIVGGTGQGKTTLLQHLILEDLKSDKSVVVVDSQGDLIPQLARLDLSKKVILIDPRDNPTLNVFDIPQQGEQAFNQTLEVFSYLFNSLLGADLTVRQATLFNYIVQLMLTLPKTGRNATLLDIMQLMDDAAPYAKAIDLLEPIPREFFRSDFNQKTYAGTKEQIRYRLQAILGNKTLARLFLAPENTIDFYEELNDGSVILIDTAKAYLGAKNSSYMGRIAITLILNAILSRAGTSHRHPTMLYLDEAAEYFDKSIDTFLTEARKQRAGMTIAHQYLGQMSPELRGSVASNTAVKFAGGLSMQDARTLAPDMRCTTEFLQSQKKLHFGCFVRNATPEAISVHVPFGVLDGEQELTEEEYTAFRERNRRLVTGPELESHVAEPEVSEQAGGLELPKRRELI